MIESGRISEEEAEHLIVQSLKQPGAEGQEEFKAKTERKTKVETKDLVSALNEHLELRMEGNKLYGRLHRSQRLACMRNDKKLDFCINCFSHPRYLSGRVDICKLSVDGPVCWGPSHVGARSLKKHVQNTTRRFPS
jgi:hypothetical protein